MTEKNPHYIVIHLRMNREKKLHPVISDDVIFYYVYYWRTVTKHNWHIDVFLEVSLQFEKNAGWSLAWLGKIETNDGDTNRVTLRGTPHTPTPTSTIHPRGVPCPQKAFANWCVT